MLADRVRMGRFADKKDVELIAGDIISYEVTNEVMSNQPNFEKVREIRIHGSGTVRVTFNLKSEKGGVRDMSLGIIKINNLDAGKRQDTISTEYTTFTEDFNVKKGDILQLFLSTLSFSGGAYNNLFQISLAEPVPSHVFETLL